VTNDHKQINISAYMLTKSIFNLINILKIFLINLIVLYVFLYAIEVFFQIKNGTFLNESKYSYRERLSNETLKEVNLAFAPYKILHKETNLLPLSGISNSRTIFCSETKGQYHEYKSDENGFNNSNNNKNFDILMIGDSYVHGLCLDQKYNLPNYISSNNFQVKNLGIMANGPLFEYAIFREYSHIYNFDTLVWLFNPDNDFYDFSNEIQNPILNKYLEEKDFTQQLVKKNDLKDLIIKNYLDYEKRKLKESLKHYHLDIKYVRNSISNIIDRFSIKSEHEIYSSNIDDISNENHIKIIYEILEDVNRSLKIKDIKFLIVFNANHPYYKYPKNAKYSNDSQIIINQTNELLTLLKRNGIPFYNFDEYIDKNFNENNISIVFKKVPNPKGYDHYTPYGNKILSEKIIEKLRLIN